MFYSQFILAKKGPLGTIWIAAHLERKLRKNQVADTDIGVSVDSILFPEMPIALRLSSHLLLGVVRIYSRKVNYLFDDCSEALLKVKQAFRSTAVDLPPEESTAPYHSITLPETFDLDDFELPDNDIFQGNYVDHHISSRDQITLQDTMEGVVYSTSKFGLDERFGDGDASGLDLDEELFVEKAATGGQASGTLNSNVDPQASLHATSPKHDENQGAPTVPEVMPANSDVNQIEDFDGDNEPVEYAQAPCTPGLWEEPNLSNIQETSACDDNHEPESHNVTESAVKENLEIASSKETEYFPPEEEHNQFRQQEKSLSAMVETEQMLMGDLDLTPFTNSFEAVQVRSTSPKEEALDTMVGPSDGHDKIEDVLDENDRDKVPEVQSVDDSHENHVELQGIQENISHTTIELDSNTEPLGNPEEQALREPKDCNISALSDHYSMPSSDFPILRPCVTQLNPSETNGEGPDATEAVERNWQEIHVSEENQVAPNVSNELVDNIIQVDNIGSYISSDFPAPEKLLSVTEGLSNVPKDLLLESTPAKDITRVDGHYAGSDMLTGKKRSFTENSLETQSFNLVESSGLFTTNITAQSALDDDDLLSSILVGRKSSFLKVKPTPPGIQSTKRRRSAPRTGVYKRKVLMDDNMVLHGDTIRLQLMNTEDIRRLRKKAPCTRPEISMIQKQFWEDELFSETILTGLSIELASLHSQSHDLSKIKVSQSEASPEGAIELKLVPQSDENGKQLEVATENIDVFVGPDVPKENGGEPNFDPVTSKDACEAHPIEVPLMTENQSFDNNIMDLGYYGSQAHVNAVGDVAEPFNSEHELLGQRAAAEIDAKTFSDAADIGISVIPIDVESLTHKSDVVSSDVVSSDACDMLAAVGQVEMHNFLQNDKPRFQSDEKIDMLSIDMDPCMIGGIKVDIASVGEISETKHEPLVEEVEDGTSVKILTDYTDCLENSQIANTKFSSGADGLRPDFVTLDQEMEEIRKSEEEFVNNDSALDPEVVHNADNLVSNGMFVEELVTVAPYDTEVNLCLKDASLDDRENPGHQVASPRNELNYSAAENDTDFLNFDDDDDDGETEAAGDYLPNSEATRYIDNSGWSSRTKAVAKYLQIMFDKEGERERKVLPLNKLLAGKTRKEASRMFFETLVLKTKDYIHVEQKDPYEIVDILPQAKLLKSDF